MMLITADFDYGGESGTTAYREQCDTFYREVEPGEWGAVPFSDWDDAASDDCTYSRVGMNTGETWTFVLSAGDSESEDRFMDYRLAVLAD